MEKKDSSNKKIENSDINSNSENIKEESPNVSTELSKVASDPKQGIAIIVIIALAILYVVYGMFFGESQDSGEDKNPKISRPKIISKPTREGDVNSSPVVASLPEAPSIGEPIKPPSNLSSIDEAPIPPSLDNDKRNKDAEISAPKIELKSPPIISRPGSTQVNDRLPSAKTISPISRTSSAPIKSFSPIPKVSVDPQLKKEMEKRRKSSIMLIAGEVPKSQEELEQNVSFKKRQNLEYTLSKGKMIDAVIETAVNSDFAGDVRAIISRDVYSESGKIVLIPKGSKIYGTFGSRVDDIYGRVDINWSRIDLSSGYSVNFSGIATDQLGKRGAPGRLDTKIKEKIGNVLLSTTVNTLFAGALDKMIKPQSTGNQSQSAGAESKALQSAVSAAFSDPATQLQYEVKISNMCSGARNAISNKANPQYLEIDKICVAMQSSTDAPENKVSALFSKLMEISSLFAVEVAVNSTPSKEQEATQKGMEEFSKTVKDIIGKNDQKSTVTIDQGTKIKILVNQDLRFPKSAVSSSRLIQ